MPTSQTEFLIMLGVLEWDVGLLKGGSIDEVAKEPNEDHPTVRVVAIGGPALLRVPVLYLIPAAQPEPMVYNWPYLRHAFTGIHPLAPFGRLSSSGGADGRRDGRRDGRAVCDKVVMLYERTSSHGGKRECTNQPEILSALKRWSSSTGRGYTVVKFNSADYTQQQTVALFASAAVVVGVHGVSNVSVCRASSCSQVLYTVQLLASL
jgi:hypothetical protein